MGLKNQMTEISKKEWEHLEQGCLTACEIVKYLQTEHTIRYFSDVLLSVYQGEDIEGRLFKEFDNSRTIYNWLHNRNLPSQREDVFRIAFALDLSEFEANRLLEYVFDQGIHYRNAKEVVYAYALKNHVKYSVAKINAERFANRKDNVDSNVDLTEEEKELTRVPVGCKTDIVKIDFDQLHCDEDFVSFMLRHSMDFGEYHNTAYQIFMEMILLLQQGVNEERYYSVEYITDTYLRMKVPESRNLRGYTTMQKIIKRYWPGLRNVKAMINRKEDISRKVLVILYLVTGGNSQMEYDPLDEEQISPIEMLEVHSERLNMMLKKCGMRGIDPRDPFDYLALYCLKVKEGEEMSARMEELVVEIFRFDEQAPSCMQ